MIEKIKLSNWKKHENLEIDFCKGSNIIIGSMGCGKTSILQAITYSLFGTFNELKKRDIKTADLINKNSKARVAKIEIHLRDLNNNKLIISRRIEAEKNSEAIIKDEKGNMLAGPNPTAVNDYISDKLKLSEDIFLRTVYSIQNEADALIRLSPADRKKQIDELMNLDKFEIGRKSCVSLRNKLLERQKGMEVMLDKENKNEIQSSIRLIESELVKLKIKRTKSINQLNEKGNRETSVKKELDFLKLEKVKIVQLSLRKNKLKNEIADIKLKLIGLDSEFTLDEIDKSIQKIKENSKMLEETKSLLETERYKKQNEFILIEKDLSVSENKIEELTKQISKIIELRQRLETIESETKFTEMNTNLSKITSEIKEMDEVYRENVAEINNLRKHMHELDIISDVCPLCCHEINLTTKEKLISERKREIAKLLMNNNEISNKLKMLRTKNESLTKIYEEQKEILSKLEEENELRNKKEELISTSSRKIRTRTTLSKMLEESRFKLKSVDTDLSQSSSKIQELINKKYLVEIRSREKQLSEELEDVLVQLDSVSVNDNKIEKLEKIYVLLSEKLQELRTFISSSEIIVKEKKLRLVEIKNKLKQFSESEKEIKTIGKKADFLSKLKNAIIDAQGILRDDLILAVNEIMSSVWLEIYPYEAWSGLRLSTDSNDYTLQLKDPESDWINVNGYASGGERMLASLAAKIAFARVLAPTLNMLVLDEPTHNLDEKAVKNFIEVLHEKVSEFIDQIFIITHDERLAESANKVIKLI